MHRPVAGFASAAAARLLPATAMLHRHLPLFPEKPADTRSRGESQEIFDQVQEFHGPAGNQRLQGFHRQRVRDQQRSQQSGPQRPTTGVDKQGKQGKQEEVHHATAWRHRGPNDSEQAALFSVIDGLIKKARIHWDDIGGLEEIKSEVKRNFGLSQAKSQRIVLPESPNILLYGPPGTGKTLLAEAISNGLEATFFCVSGGDMTSKYFGESQKLIQALFLRAKQKSPSVIFIDEFDALVSSRDTGLSGPETRIVSQFLTEFDGFDSGSSDAFILGIAATNQPWILDKAILSRFPRRIYIPLPDAETRIRILELHLQKMGYDVSTERQFLIHITGGLSGREIKDVANEAKRLMLMEANPKFEQKVDAGLKSLQEYDLMTTPISQNHISRARATIAPAADDALLMRYKNWESGLNEVR